MVLTKGDLLLNRPCFITFNLILNIYMTLLHYSSFIILYKYFIGFYFMVDKIIGKWSYALMFVNHGLILWYIKY